MHEQIMVKVIDPLTREFVRANVNGFVDDPQDSESEILMSELKVGDKVTPIGDNDENPFGEIFAGDMEKEFYVTSITWDEDGYEGRPCIQTPDWAFGLDNIAKCAIS